MLPPQAPGQLRCSVLGVPLEQLDGRVGSGPQVVGAQVRAPARVGPHAQPSHTQAPHRQIGVAHERRAGEAGARAVVPAEVARPGAGDGEPVGREEAAGRAHHRGGAVDAVGLDPAKGDRLKSGVEA